VRGHPFMSLRVCTMHAHAVCGVLFASLGDVVGGQFHGPNFRACVQGHAGTNL
jgi:hypothetical protein